MKKKIVSGLMLTMLLTGMLTIAFGLGFLMIPRALAEHITVVKWVESSSTLTFNFQPVGSSKRPDAVFFTSGFETGDYSEWTETWTEGGATIGLVSDVKHHGLYSSRATFTEPWQGAWSGIYGLSANPVHVRWYARFDILPSNYQAFTLIESIDSNGYSIWDLDIHRGLDPDGTLGLWFYRNRPSIGNHYYSYNFEANTWYCFEVKFYLHASIGEYRVYLDGVEVITLTGLNTSGSSWTGIKLGRGSGYLSSLTTWADCVKIADTYIGSEVTTILSDIRGPEDPPGSGLYPPDGVVDIWDLGFMGLAYGKTSADPDWEDYKIADIRGPENPPGSGLHPPDGQVDLWDFNYCGLQYGQSIYD